jgi:methylaspartate ammonia-lyase
MPKKELGSLTHPFSAACVCAGEREGAFFGSACANTPVETSAVATGNVQPVGLKAFPLVIRPALA